MREEDEYEAEDETQSYDHSHRVSEATLSGCVGLVFDFYLGEVTGIVYASRSGSLDLGRVLFPGEERVVFGMRWHIV